jgi:hypothetical protein
VIVKIVHTAQQIVKAMVDKVTAWVCWPDVTVVVVMGPASSFWVSGSCRSVGIGVLI